MASVEDRIVGMKFDSKQFEPAAKAAMSTLDKLKQSLNFKGSSKGLQDVQNTASRFSLGGLSSAAEGISGKFLAMSTIAITAISSITTKAIDAGVRIGKALTIDPAKAGFEEYETNLNSVQTILANTQSSGATLKDVNAALFELNTYSDKTIYNFGEMARNIGTFTAAGVDLKTSTMSIKGIANLAALSGSNSQQASTAMYQLSQAISAGRVGLQDWNSVVNAGMGGTVFQRALAQTAEKMGTLSKGSVELKGKMKNVSIEGQSFRESITAKPGEESWLTSKVLTETLKQFTGDMSDAELASMGFTKAQIKNIQAQAKTAQDAATKVKTFTQLIGTLQEASGSGWSQTFQILLGDFEEAKSLWTNVNKVLGGFIGKSADARNKMLQDWKDLGGRGVAIKGLSNIFKALVAVVKPIGQAFRQIFPATTGKQLFDLTKSFLNFTKTLKIGSGTADKIKRTFAGVFAIFSIGWSIVKALLGVFGDLFGVAAKGSGGFLEVTANIGDFLVALDQTIKKGDLINKFFDGLKAVLAVPIALFHALGLIIAGLFEGFDAGASEGVSSVFERIRARLAPLVTVGDKVSVVWTFLTSLFKKLSKVLAPVGAAIGKALSGVGKAIGDAFKAGDFSSVFDALNTGLLTGITLLIANFMKKGIKVDFGGGLFGNISKAFETLTGTLTAMQNNIKADTLMKIAIAVGILTLSIVALSLIDSKKLASAMAGIGVALGQLLASMAILDKISSTTGFAKIPVIATSMLLLAAAILILSASVLILSTLSWEELAKGLTGVGALLLMIVGVSKLLGPANKGIMRAGIAMIPLSIGLLLLSVAVKSFAKMSWADMAKGMAGLAASLLIIAAAMNLMPKSMVLQAVGLLILSVALIAISKALSNMGGMSWEEIGKSMVVLAGSLILLAAAMIVMTEGLPGAAAMLVAAAALVILAPALKSFSSMSWEEIGKAMTVLAGSLLILAGGLLLMTGSVVGVAALMIATIALGLLVPVLIALGAMSWASIVKGLVAIAAVFLVLGIAGMLLAPLVPVILAVSVALLLMGVAVILVGAGLLAIATAFGIFVAAGTAGIAVLSAMIGLIPLFMSKLAEGIIGFATTLANSGTKLTNAFASLLLSLINAVIKIIPRIGALFSTLIKTAVQVVLINAPRLATAGIRLLIIMLTAISNNIGKIVAVVANLITRFLSALSAQQGKVLSAGAKFIVNFINGLARTIRSNQSAMNSAARSLASAIISGMTGGLSDAAWRVAQKAASVARDAIAAAKNALGIKSPSKEFFKIGGYTTEGFALGLEKTSKVVDRSAEGVGKSALISLKESMKDVSSILDDTINSSPVIKPVMDLSRLSSDASNINDMFGKKTISAGVSFSQASGISNDQQRRDQLSADAIAAETPSSIEFNQYITSPEALTPIEIYRNTKAQLSMAKGVLART